MQNAQPSRANTSTMELGDSFRKRAHQPGRTHQLSQAWSRARPRRWICYPRLTFTSYLNTPAWALGCGSRFSPFPLGWAESVKSPAKSDLIDPAGEGGPRQDKFECPPSIYLNFDCNRDDCKVVPPASKPKHSMNTNGRGAESLLHTELVQGIRRKFLSASVFGITSDPVSYSQAIISSQLSQHLFCVSCLLGDSHLRYPFEQPEGSSLPGCSASPALSSHKWTPSLLSTSTSESAEVACSARPRRCCQATGLSSFTLNEIPMLPETLQNMGVWFPASISGFGS